MSIATSIHIIDLNTLFDRNVVIYVALHDHTEHFRRQSAQIQGKHNTAGPMIEFCAGPDGGG